MDSMDSTRKSARIPLGTVKSTVEKFTSKSSDKTPDKAKKPAVSTSKSGQSTQKSNKKWIPRQETKFSQPPRQPRPFLLTGSISRNTRDDCNNTTVSATNSKSSGHSSTQVRLAALPPTTATTVLPVVYPRAIPLVPNNESPVVRRHRLGSSMDTDSLDAVIPPPTPGSSSPESLTTSTDTSKENSPTAAGKSLL